MEEAALNWTPRTRAGKALAAIAFVAGSLTTIAIAWRTFDFPVPAWATDIKRLDRQQVDTAIEVYQNKYRSWLALPPAKDATSEQARQIEIDRALKQLERAEQRKIELSK